MEWHFLRAALPALVSAAALPAMAQGAATMPPFDAYGDLAAIESAEISPSGAHTALVMTAQGQRQVLIFDAAGAPVRNFVIGDVKVRWIEWVGDEAVLLVRSETDNARFGVSNWKQEWYRANVIPLDPQGEVISVFAGQRSIANAVIGYHGMRQVDGRWLGYFGGFRMGRTSGEDTRLLDDQPALFAVDMRTGQAQQVAFPAQWPVNRDWLVAADGRVGATLDIDSQTGAWIVEGPDGKILARGSSPTGSVSLIGFGAAGDSVIYSIFDEDEESARRFDVPFAGGTPTELPVGAVEQWVQDPYTGRVLGTIARSGEVELADEALEDALSRTLALFARGNVTLSDHTPGLSAVIVRTSGNYDSGSWYRVDLADGQRSMLGLERPAIQGPAIGKISTFEYQAADGLSIDAILTLPPGREAKGLPVVILPHGGPTAHDEPEFDWWAQAFASRGYAVLQPNFRGSTNRGEEFRAAGDGEWGRKMQTDLSDGLAALAAEGIVDPARACIVGASYGGYAALAGVTIQNGVYRCAVSVNGVADLDSMFRGEFSGRRTIFRNSLEQLFGPNPDFALISPYRLAGRADAPVLLNHGRDDTRVPYAQSVRMEDALSDAGKDVTLVTLDGEDHFLSSAATRKAMLAETIDFVLEHNPPE